MAQVAPKLLTFEEFAALNSEGRYELVDGRLEELVAPTLRHGWSGGRFFAILDAYLAEHEPTAYWGVEVDVPTLPFCGRRPDVVYFSTDDAARYTNVETDEVSGVPTLAIEVLSSGDEKRDLVEKRREYAAAGVQHYWIGNPTLRTVTCLRLKGGEYEVVDQFTRDDVLTSDLFPGLEVPVASLFR